VTTIFAGLTGLVLGFVKAIINFFANLYAELFSGGRNSITGIMDTIYQTFLRLHTQVSVTIQNWIRNTIAFFVDFIATGTEHFALFWDWFIGSVREFIANFSENFEEWKENITGENGLIATFVDNVIQWFIDMKTKVLVKVIEFIQGVKDSIRENLIRPAANLGVNLVEGLINGISSQIGALAAKAREMALAALNAARHIFDSDSPSKAFMEIGGDVVKGFNIGVEANTASAEEQMMQLGEKAKLASQEAFAQEMQYNQEISKRQEIGRTQVGMGILPGNNGPRPVQVSTSFGDVSLDSRIDVEILAHVIEQRLISALRNT